VINTITMDRPLNLDGKLNTTLSTICEPLSNGVTRIVSIMFNNDSINQAYGIEVHKKTYSGSTVLLYRLELGAGEMVHDNCLYILDSKTSLMAKSDVSGTNFIITGYTTTP